MQLAVVPDHHAEYLLADPVAAYGYLQGERPEAGRLARWLGTGERAVPQDWPVAPTPHELIDENEYPSLIHYLLNGRAEQGQGVSDAILGACRGELAGTRQLGPHRLFTFLHDKSQAAAFDAHLRALDDSIVEARWREDVAARGERPDPLELVDFQAQLNVLREVYGQAARQARAVLFAPNH